MTLQADAQGIVSVAHLRRYLQVHGWNSRDFAEGRLALYTLPATFEGDSDIEVVLPTSDRKGFEQDIRAALRTLSQLVDRSIEQIVSDIRALGFDIIRSRVPDEYVREDSIELRVAAEFLEGMKTLLATTATAELKPFRFNPRMLPKGAEYASRCRFGHTFHGSFGFIVESPLEMNREPQIFESAQSPPFERQVVQRLMRGLLSIPTAMSKEDPSFISQSYETGLNANMCDALGDLIEETGIARFKIGVTLSPEWKPVEDMENIPELTMELRHVELLREAAKTLRRDEESTWQTIVGRVQKLEAEGNPADLLHNEERREVQVHWDSPDGLVKVRVVLGPEDYLAAVDAHKAGHPIRVKGLLTHPGRNWILQNPSDFSVTSD